MLDLRPTGSSTQVAHRALEPLWARFGVEHGYCVLDGYIWTLKSAMRYCKSVPNCHHKGFHEDNSPIVQMYQSLYGYHNRHIQSHTMALKARHADFQIGAGDSSSASRPSPKQASTDKKRVIMAMACTTDLTFGIKILLALRKLNVESHLVVSAQTKHGLEADDAGDLAGVQTLADHVYSEEDLKATIAQTDFRADATIVLSCDSKRLASIATGSGHDLTSRAAHMMLEEHGNLVLMFGDNPYIAQHIRDLVSITKAGGIVFPGVSSFSAEMGTMEESAFQLVRSVLEAPLYKAR